MVRNPSVDKNGLIKGAWSEEEDNKLRAYIQRYGPWNWRQLPKFAGLSRCGKSCRLRWLNYLKPGLKKGNYSQQEEELIIKLREELGNKWSVIAERLPGRTDNDIKNYWHAHLKKQRKQDPKSSKSLEQTSERSQHLHVPEQNQQASVMFISESTQNRVPEPDIAAAADADADADADAFPHLSSNRYNSILLGLQELCTEDSISSVESFAQTSESFWTEPFSLDTSYNQFAEPFESFSTEPFSLDKSYNQFAEPFESFCTAPFSLDTSLNQISSSTSCNSTLSNWVSEDGISSVDLFAEPFESFFTEPISIDTSYNQISSSTSCNSTLLDWVTEDSSSSVDLFTEPFESFSTEHFL